MKRGRGFVRTTRWTTRTRMRVEVKCGQPSTKISGTDGSEGDVEFVLFEDVNGHEVYVNPERVVWVRELGDRRTVISCGQEHTFTVRLSPAQAVATLGVKVR